jgi:hypothetical protein
MISQKRSQVLIQILLGILLSFNLSILPSLAHPDPDSDTPEVEQIEKKPSPSKPTQENNHTVSPSPTLEKSPVDTKSVHESNTDDTQKFSLTQKLPELLFLLIIINPALLYLIKQKYEGQK